MKRHAPPLSIPRARQLRREMTEAERRMWRLLREVAPAARWRRQVPLRHFIADFASHREKLVVEVDGGQHSAEADAVRTAIIEAEGYRVLRFWNNEVLANLEGVRSSIASTLALNPSPDLRFAPATLSPQGRGTGGARAATTKQRSYRLNAEPINE